MTLFGQYFRAQFKGFLIWLGVGVLYAFLLSSSARSFVDTNSLENLPPSLLVMFGDIKGFNPIDGYIAFSVIKGLGWVPPLYAVIVALSVVTREVDRRTVEFLLALPVRRTQLLASRIAVVFVNLTLVVGAEWAITRLDLARQGYVASWGNVFMVFLNIWLLTLALGAVTLMASMWIDDYSLGVKLCLGLLSLALFVDLALKAANVSKWVRAFSPFSYVDAAEVIRSGGIAWSSLITLLAAIAVGVGVSFWAFNRKQFTA
jgi:ABC-2 type transport system permease protein